MAGKGKRHRFSRDTVAGQVVLNCRCGWRGWPPPDPLGRETGEQTLFSKIPPEREQWTAFWEHVRDRRVR